MTENKVGSVNEVKQVQDKEGGGVDIGRHQAQRTICSYSCRQEIDDLFVDWVSPDLIVKRFTNISRDSVYRHAHAFDLFTKRRKNIRMALEKIVERVDFTAMSGSVILSAIKAIEKLNSEGQGVENMQSTDSKKLFDRMSPGERAAFAEDGSLPDWFSRAKGETSDESQEGEREGQVPEPQRLQ